MKTKEQTQELIKRFLSLPHAEKHYPHTHARALSFMSQDLTLTDSEQNELYNVVLSAIQHICHLNERDFPM